MVPFATDAIGLKLHLVPRGFVIIRLMEESNLMELAKVLQEFPAEAAERAAKEETNDESRRNHDPMEVVFLECREANDKLMSEEATIFFQALAKLACRCLVFRNFEDFPLIQFQTVLQHAANTQDKRYCLQDICFGYIPSYNTQGLPKDSTAVAASTIKPCTFHGEISIPWHMARGRMSGQHHDDDDQADSEFWALLQRTVLIHPETLFSKLRIMFSCSLSSESVSKRCLIALGRLQAKHVHISLSIGNYPPDISELFGCAVWNNRYLQSITLELYINHHALAQQTLAHLYNFDQQRRGQIAEKISRLSAFHVHFRQRETRPNYDKRQRLLIAFDQVMPHNYSLEKLTLAYAGKESYYTTDTVQMYLALNQNHKRQRLRQDESLTSQDWVDFLCSCKEFIYKDNFHDNDDISIFPKKVREYDRFQQDAVLVSCFFYFLRRNPQLYATMALSHVDQDR